MFCDHSYRRCWEKIFELKLSRIQHGVEFDRDDNKTGPVKQCFAG